MARWRRRWHRLGASVGLALIGLGMCLFAARVWARPAGRHCGDVGPLPLDNPNFCGCTWGEVYFQGQPVVGAVVTLTFGEGVVTKTTRSIALEPYPYFDLTAHDLGARRGEVLTLTATFAGETVTRTFRAWPDAGGEQYVALALTMSGVWQPWLTGGYTRALALDGDTVWAGGPAGLISVSLTSGISVPHTLAWTEQSVRALAVTNAGHVWAVGAGGVAEFDGVTWQSHALPVVGTPRALAVSSAGNMVFIGGGDSQGYVAWHAGTFMLAWDFSAPVTALALDTAGRLWAGTWGAGVFRQDGQGGWTQFRDTLGLASDWVLAATASTDAVWFGTSPYLSGSGPRGGIARYDLATGVWRVFTTTHGLPADAWLPQTPAPVYALAVDPRGWVWAGVADGVRYLPTGESWRPYTAIHGLRAGPAMALAARDADVIATSAVGLERLRRAAPLDNPPAAQIDSVSPETLLPGGILTLQGSGNVAAGRRIIAWDWASEVAGPLCTAADCALPHALFAPGAHRLAFRVQDDAGLWSAPVSAEMTVRQGWCVFLPLALRGN